MRLARLLHLARRRAFWFAGAILASPALLGGARAEQCDYSGFESPCKAGGGEYRVLMPESEGPFPAMVFLHGSGGRSEAIAGDPLLEAAVAGRGYALVVPVAEELTYANGLNETGWTLRAEAAQGGGAGDEPRRDEAAFVGEVIEDAARRFPLDRERVLLAGHSRGGFLVWEIACHEPDLATAYAVHAAGYLGALPEACEEPVRFLHAHGRADFMVPMTGLPARPGGIGIPPMFETLRLIARANGCEEEPGEATPYLGFRRQGWSGCAPGSRLDLMLHDGGHGMPASWFRAAIDWFEEPLPEPEGSAPVVRRIGQDLPGGGAATRASGRFKAPPAPGARALTSE